MNDMSARSGNTNHRQTVDPGAPAVAVIGMAGRFPGAPSLERFWDNLCRGVDTISRFEERELEDDFPPHIRSRPEFVRARSVLADVDQFDAPFFGMMPRDAAFTDPQHRIFLECCWEALERGGWDPSRYPGAVGVYAGSSLSSYLWRHVLADRAAANRFCSDYQVGSYPELVGSLPDFLATRVSYKLNLRGPAVNVQSACSTSLLAVVQACQALLNFQCDMALAGGVSISFPQHRGYLAAEGGLASLDGTCRPFDVDANGTVFGSGAGVVLLKRLEDALADGDHIHGVIRGFGVNNDGSDKVGFAAPSINGQAEAIRHALEMAGLTADQIGYVEAHGTGTPLGDPIEFAALVKAFRQSTDARNFCILGSAKANIGHVDAAAGVVALMKALLTLEHESIPPLAHFTKPNPHIDVGSSPFRFVKDLTPWPQSDVPRFAGVSSFGVGGTNVHVVVEEAPKRPAAGVAAGPVVLPLSARSLPALEAARQRLARYLEEKLDCSLADVAWTLQSGRKAFEHRFAVVADDAPSAVRALADLSRPSRKATAAVAQGETAFLFPGQGSQYAGMGSNLFGRLPAFTDAMLACSRLLEPHLGRSLVDWLYATGDRDALAQEINNTEWAQPSIFAVAYAMARQWEAWGIRPGVMIGHSVGEFVAACLAGVMSLEDALKLVALRGRLMQGLEKGAMVSVRLPAEETRRRLTPDLSVAAINAPTLCVVAGPMAAIEAFERSLGDDGVVFRRLQTSHAFHSAMMDPAVPAFREEVLEIALSAPKIAIISSVTGELLSDAQACNPEYWARYLRETVNFSAAMQRLRTRPELCLIEVGPGTSLATLARQHPAPGVDQVVVSSWPPSGQSGSEATGLFTAAATLWQAGRVIDWVALNGPEAKSRGRVPLPTYPFERKRHWVEPAAADATNAALGVEQPQDQSAVAASAMSPDKPVVSSEIAMTAMPPEKTVVQNSSSLDLQARIISVFEKVSGLTMAGSDPGQTFMDWGFDSLLLTQAARAIQTEFGIKIAFRQLMGEQGSVASLAAYLAERSPKPAKGSAGVVATGPAPAVNAAAPPVSAAPFALPAPGATVAAVIAPAVQVAQAVAGESQLERVMRDQLALLNSVISGQIDVLKSAQGARTAGLIDPAPVAVPGGAVAAPAAPTPQPAPAVAAKPAVATPAAVPEPKVLGPYSGLVARDKGGLTAHQTAHLAELVARVERRAPISKRTTQETRKVLADPRVASGFRDIWKEIVFPVVVNRSKGSKLWDIDGNSYIDLLNGFGPIMFGHRPDFIENALGEQLGEGMEVGPQSPLAGEIAQMFCEMTGNERMTFCNTGSEAVMAAFRLARTVTGRDTIVSFSGGYHGMFDEVLISPRRGGGEPGALPIAPGIPAQSVANMVVLEYGTDESVAWIRAHADELAAVIVEPVQSRRPQVQPVAFLKSLREVTEQSGTALIFDEVVTGFRSHPGGCQALFGIRSDMATYGKVLGGGMPIGVLAGRAEFMDALDGGQWQYGDASLPEVGVTFFAGTFVRHPLALAAVKAVLRHLKAEGPSLQEKLTARTEGLVRRINEVLGRYGTPTTLYNFSSVFYFKFPPEERLASLFYVMLRENGIHVLEGFPCFLTTAHSDADIDAVVAAFERAAKGMQEARFFATVRTETEQPPVAAPTADQRRPGAGIALTEAQREIFLSAMLDAEASCAFNEGFTVFLDGDLDAEAFRAGLAEIVARHEALRASVDSDGATLTIAAGPVLAMFDVDLSKSSPDEQRVAMDALLEEEARTPFDLYRGPLVRARLVRLGQSRHALVFCAHHIVCDGWSANIIIGELAEFYSARIERRPPVLEPAVRFVDYAAARAQAQSGPEGRAVEAYWLDKFKDKPSPVDLPTDRPRGLSRTSTGATVSCRIEPALTKACRELAARQKSSLFMVLFSAFNALVARLSGASDITIAVPMAAQAHLDNGNLVGHCVDFLPLRTTLAPDTTFASLLQAARTTVLDAYDHQAYTYGSLVKALDVRRDPVRLPLTELQFNLEQLGRAAAFKGLSAEIVSNAKSAVNSDLFVNVIDAAEALIVTCDFNTDLYDHETVKRWMQAYGQVLEGAAAAVDKPLSALALDLSARVPAATLGSEDAALVASWNDSGADYPRSACIHQLFEQQAARTPNRVALTQLGEALTYDALNRRANQLARHLASLGAGPGKLVGICVDRTPTMIVALLAVQKSGAAYVPLDPTHPKDRIAFTLADAGIEILVTQASLDPLLPRHRETRVLVDTDASVIDSRAADNLAAGVSSSDRAYVMYTSGSTGKPKGVAISHASLANFLWSMQREPGLSQADVLAAVTTITFDIAGLEIYLPLVTGARVELVPPAIARDGGALSRHLATCGATVLQATPATWRMMIDSGWAGDAKLRALCGGEALPRALANEICSRVGVLWNLYGPTETTIWSTLQQITRGDGPIAIGRPIANTQIHIVDETGNPVAIGAAGEIWIGGDGVAMEYHRRPELTAERFVKAVAWAPGAGTVYRTGDLGRWLADGRLEHLGRMDNQIKLRGFRVELGEIEATIQEVRGVKQTHLVADTDDAGSTRLVAFCVPSAKGSVSVADIIEHASSKLPDFMVPVSLVLLEQYPLTANGKIDRAALLAIEREARGSRQRVAPSTDAESKLAAIVAEVVRVEEIGVTDNLFEVGVDSLKIFQIASRAEKAGLAVTPRGLMKGRTIRGALGEAASSNRSPAKAALSIKPVARDRYRVRQEGAAGHANDRSVTTRSE